MSALPRRRAVIGLVAVALAGLLAGCSLQPEAEPRNVPQEEQGLIVLDVGGGSDAAGGARIYLVGPGESGLLRSAQRDARTARNLIEILLQGPNEDELAAQYSTAIPRTVDLLSARLQSRVLQIDLSPEITELTGPGLIQALAQLVYTAAEIEEVTAVEILVEGSPLSWPTGTGRSTTDPLRTFDYPGAVRTSQPAYPAVPSAA